MSSSPVGPHSSPHSKRGPANSTRAALEHEPTVLLVGDGDPLAEALGVALKRRGLTVEQSSTGEGVDAAVTLAPDLVLLVGDAAQACGADVLKQLRATPLAAPLPAVLLADPDHQAQSSHPDAFRFGAAAAVPRNITVEAIAVRVDELVREIPNRSGKASGELGSTSIDEVARELTQEPRSGILSVKGNARDDETLVRIALGEGREASALLDGLVSKVRPLMRESELLRYVFQEQPGGTLQFLTPESGEPGTPEDIRNLRVLLADDDRTRAHAVSQTLRSHQAEVWVTDFAEPDWEKLAAFDPAVFVIDETAIDGPGYALLRRVRGHLRLRWAPLLVVRWDDVCADAREGLDSLIARVGSFGEPERALRQKAESGQAFEVRLEAFGPARLIRALVETERTLKVTFSNRQAQVQIELTEGLVAGGACPRWNGAEVELTGPTALAALLAAANGRVRVEPSLSPALANIMASPEFALNAAQNEAPAIAALKAARPTQHSYVPPPPPPPTAKVSLSELVSARSLSTMSPRDASGRPSTLVGIPTPPPPPDLLPTPVSDSGAETTDPSLTPPVHIPDPPTDPEFRAPPIPNVAPPPAPSAAAPGSAAAPVAPSEAPPTPPLSPPVVPAVPSPAVAEIKVPPAAIDEVTAPLSDPLGSASTADPRPRSDDADPDEAERWLRATALQGRRIRQWTVGTAVTAVTVGIAVWLVAQQPETVPAQRAPAPEPPTTVSAQTEAAPETADPPNREPGFENTAPPEAPPPSRAEEPRDGFALEGPPALPPSTGVLELPDVPRAVARLRAGTRRFRAKQMVRRAKRHIKRRRYRQAQTAALRALEHEPESGMAAQTMALALYRDRQTEKALDWLRRALELEPGRSGHWVLLGDAWGSLGKVREARRAWEYALDLQPSNRAAQRRLRKSRRRAGR